MTPRDPNGEPKPIDKWSMRERYRFYRQWHGRLISSTLAPPPEWFVYAMAAVFGWNLWRFF